MAQELEALAALGEQLHGGSQPSGTLFQGVQPYSGLCGHQHTWVHMNVCMHGHVHHTRVCTHISTHTYTK